MRTLRSALATVCYLLADICILLGDLCVGVQAVADAVRSTMMGRKERL